jgi:hypothetical protein
MVNLEAHKMKDFDGSIMIVISEDSFEHLLNCLDNQKFIPLPEQQSEFEKTEMQAYIDDFNHQCRELLHET